MQKRANCRLRWLWISTKRRIVRVVFRAPCSGLSCRCVCTESADGWPVLALSTLSCEQHIYTGHGHGCVLALLDRCRADRCIAAAAMAGKLERKNSPSLSSHASLSFRGMRSGCWYWSTPGYRELRFFRRFVLAIHYIPVQITKRLFYRIVVGHIRQNKMLDVYSADIG